MIEPCVFCGNLPEVSPGLSDAPETAGFVGCKTVHIGLPGGDQTCPAHAESVESWNRLMRVAKRRARGER